MTDEAPFLAAIRERPDDDGPRLIFADYLDEHGDARGLFIRVQCALARTPLDDPRRRQLEKTAFTLEETYRHPWTVPFRGLAYVAEFRRGFVEAVNIEARVFLLRGHELFDLAPIQSLGILYVAGLLNPIFESPLLERLRVLKINDQHIGEALARAIAVSPHVGNLRELHLVLNRLGDAGAEALAGSRMLANLRHLDLSKNGIGDLGARAIAASPWLGQLESLNLKQNEIGFGGLEALAGSPRLPKLMTLDLSNNRVGTQRGFHFHGEPAPRLRSLSLRDNGINPASVGALVGLSSLRGLEHLDLYGNQLGNVGTETLAASEIVDSLHSLRLEGGHVGDAGAQALARSSHLGNLTALDLKHNPIHDAGWLAFLEAGSPRKLKVLGWSDLGVSQRVRRALQARFEPVGR